MLDQKCKAGETPFIKACKNGSVKVLEVFVREGAGKMDVNAKDNLGYTGFIWACINRHLAAIQELIKMDELDVNAKSNSGMTEPCNPRISTLGFPITLMKMKKYVHSVSILDVSLTYSMLHYSLVE